MYFTKRSEFSALDHEAFQLKRLLLDTFCLIEYMLVNKPQCPRAAEIVPSGLFGFLFIFSMTSVTEGEDALARRPHAVYFRISNIFFIIFPFLQTISRTCD